MTHDGGYSSRDLYHRRRFVGDAAWAQFNAGSATTKPRQFSHLRQSIDGAAQDALLLGRLLFGKLGSVGIGSADRNWGLGLQARLKVVGDFHHGLIGPGVEGSADVTFFGVGNQIDDTRVW